MGYIRDKVGQEVRDRLRGYERFTYEEIAPIPNARKDYEGYSTILINTLDRNGKYHEVILEDSSKNQRLANPVKYLVLVDRVGNTKGYYATGKIVRKDIIFGEGTTKQSSDNNVEVL